MLFKIDKETINDKYYFCLKCVLIFGPIKILLNNYTNAIKCLFVYE